MSDAIFLYMPDGKPHALCAVAGISNEKHQAFARHEAASGRTAAAPWPHAHAVFAVCASARYVRLRGDHVPSTDHRACRCARDVQDDVSLVWVDNGACDAGSREEQVRTGCAQLRSLGRR